MDLKQLRTFIHVSEAGSLSRASDRLRLAQPALSRHIKLLEAELGVELFTRHGGGMAPTDAGSELLKRVGGLVEQLEKAMDDIQAMPTDPRGTVALGIPPTIGPILATRIAIRLASELPNVSLRIVEGLAGHLIEWLQQGEIDVALLPGPGADLHLRTIDLLFEEYVLVGPRGSTLSLDTPVAVADLANLDLILSSRRHGLRNVIEAAAHKAGTTLSVRFEVDTLAVALSLVEAELGYTVLPMSAIYHEVDIGRLKVAPLHHPHVPRQLILALPTSRAATRATTALIELILSEVADLIRKGIWKASADTGLQAALARPTP